MHVSFCTICSSGVTRYYLSVGFARVASLSALNNTHTLYHPRFDSYSVYYENLLRVKHQLLYQKELEVKHYKDKLKNAKDNTYTEVRMPRTTPTPR